MTVTDTTRSSAEMARLRARLDYWQKKPEVKRPPEKVLLVSTTDMRTAIEIKNPADARHGETVTIVLYRVGVLAELVDKSVQTIRLWERSFFLPDSGFRLVGKAKDETTTKKKKEDDDVKQRVYSYDQIRAVYDLVPLLEFSDHRGAGYSAFSREVWERWLAMPDGVPVEPRVESVKRKGKARRVRGG